MMSKRTRVGFAGAVLAAAALVLTAYGGDEAAERPAPRGQQQQGVAELANIARWADGEGLTGLSPASLTAINPDQHTTADLANIAEWADSEGLTGLSPASLTAINPDQHTTADLANIAEWADSEGLTGLSPASLRPVD
jgi:hypothetical protein